MYYLVIVGAYSDAHPDALFTDQDLATAHARAHEGYVVEMELSTELDEKAQRHLTPGEHLFWVGMDNDGNHAQTNEIFSAQPERWLSYRKGSAGIERFICHCVARDEAHAIKILNERRTIWRGLGEPEGTPAKVGYGWRDFTPSEII